MNKARLVWGIICLALAALLLVLNLTLPPESMRFDVGNVNMPWVPVVALAVVGIVLLGTANQPGKQEHVASVEQPASRLKSVQNPAKAALNKRLENSAWGLFLIMLGGFLLVPAETIPKGLWSIGVGLIMLGLNAARYYYKLRMSGFTTVLGILSLLGGIGELLGVTSLEGGLLLIILGAYLILKPWFEKNKLFGKAEET